MSGRTYDTFGVIIVLIILIILGSLVTIIIIKLHMYMLRAACQKGVMTRFIDRWTYRWMDKPSFSDAMLQPGMFRCLLGGSDSY